MTITLEITDQASAEITQITPVVCPLTAGTCTPERCVNENDPVAQANCPLC